MIDGVHQDIERKTEITWQVVWLKVLMRRRERPADTILHGMMTREGIYMKRERGRMEVKGQ